MTSKSLADIMIRQIAEVASGTLLCEAAKRLGQTNSDVLLVVNGTEPIGILTARSILLSLQRGVTPQTPVKDLLGAPLVMAAQSLDYRAGHHLMTKANVRHLLAVDADNRLAGIVSDSNFQQHLGTDFLSRLSCAGDVMDRDFLVLTSCDSVAEALTLIERHAASGLIVVNDVAAGVPIGIFDEHKAMRLSCGGRSLEDVRLAEAMLPVSTTIGVDMGLQDALMNMRSQQIDHLVVTGEGGEIVGLLTAQDVIRAIEDSLHDHYHFEQRRIAGEMHKLSSAVEHSPVLTIITDKLGNIEYVNPRFTQITGYAAEEVIGQNPRLLKSSQTAPDVFEDMWKTLRQGGIWTGELCNRKKNGELYWEDARILPIIAPDGSITHFLGLKEDITLRRQAENRQRLAASVFDNAHEGIMITGPDNLIIEVNNAFVALSGYSREELIGQTPIMLKSGQHGGAFYSSIRQTLEKHGQWRGEISNRKKNGDISVEQITISTVCNDKGHLLHYIGIFTDITKLRESQQRLEHLAHFDPLTHLPNRALLGDRLQQALAVARRGGLLLAVCYLDLDGFKPINDTHGSTVGNELLTEVAGRIKGSLRGGDTVARLGGDEFVLLLGEIGDLTEIEQTLSRILALVAVPYHVSGMQLRVTASIGVTIVPSDSSDPDTLVRHADQAMYVAKQAGRNRYHMFDVAEDEKARLQHDSQTRIAQALESQEFLLYYQPKVNMRTGKVTGVEALIRWQHPERGLLAPMEFLPLVEGHENIVAIGEWVMREALGQVCTWAESGLELPVSVNIAAHHLQQPGFVAKLADLLTDLKKDFPILQPEWLELEILETAALEDMNNVDQVIEECLHLGVGFAIDDFGTGYSSLTYLKQLQANTLKIDQSFIRDMLEDNDDLAIVEGVVGLTTAFQRNVIAEGVETIQHGMMLMHLGCDLAQGYGIARPMPAAAVPLWVESFVPSPAWQDSLSRPWKREDFPLLALELDHRNWVSRLLDALRTPTMQVLDENFFNPDLCRFGAWYHSHGATKFGHLDEFVTIGRLHDHTYRIGARIAQLYSSNAGHLAEELIPELHAANEELFSGLSELRREMADQEQMIHLHWAGSRVD